MAKVRTQIPGEEAGRPELPELAHVYEFVCEKTLMISEGFAHDDRLAERDCRCLRWDRSADDHAIVAPTFDAHALNLRQFTADHNRAMKP